MKNNNKITIGIDASNVKVGGAKTYLIEILANLKISDHQIKKIIVWGSQKTLDFLPELPWLQKEPIKLIDNYRLFRFYWWLFKFNSQLSNSCDILFSVGGTFLGKFRPFVAMSRNMLVFDAKESSRYGFSYNRFKYFILKLAQSYTFLNSNGIIFISKYAEETISKMLKINKSKTQFKLIHHGVSKSFINKPKKQTILKDRKIKILYVSTIDDYKHQWNLIESVSLLRNDFDIEIDFIGGVNSKNALLKFRNSLKKFDPDNNFVNYHGKLDHKSMIEFYKKSDLFIYLSTCENMPNILIEAMSTGIPIACSNYKPMPEFIKDGAVYFNPCDVGDIKVALEKMILDVQLRKKISKLSHKYALEYNWEKCSKETFEYIYDVYLSFEKLKI